MGFIPVLAIKEWICLSERDSATTVQAVCLAWTDGSGGSHL